MADLSLLLENYKKFSNSGYTVIREINIDGHDCWLMNVATTIEHDITGQGREGQIVTHNGFYCECDFTEGVGWEIRDDQRYSLDHGKRCVYKHLAGQLRHLELRKEYKKQFETSEDRLWGMDFALRRHLKDIILDLMQRVKNGEWIGETHTGAGFWGGYFYLQTVAAIVGDFEGYMWEPARELWAKKKLMLEGAVVQDYKEPPPPTWEEHASYTDGDLTVKCFLPGHRQMAQAWRFEVWQNDKMVWEPNLHEPLAYSPDFGPDVSDVENAKKKAAEYIDIHRKRNDS